MCSFRETYLHNTSNKTNSTHGKLFQRDSVTSFSFLKNPKRERRKRKKANANCHWQSFVFKVHRRIQEKVKVPGKCLFINPVGGATPSGTHVHWKIYCLGSMLRSERVYFYPFMHKTTRT